MFTFYFIIGFTLFAILFMAALDHLTILDYQKEVKAKQEEIKELLSMHSVMTEPCEARRVMAKISRLRRESDALAREMLTFPTFLRR